jgi:hypothetical protein
VNSIKKLLLMFLTLTRGPLQNSEGTKGAFLFLPLLAQLVVSTKIICLWTLCKSMLGMCVSMVQYSSGFVILVPNNMCPLGIVIW